MTKPTAGQHWKWLREISKQEQDFKASLRRAKKDLRNCNYVSYEEVFGKKEGEL